MTGKTSVFSRINKIEISNCPFSLDDDSNMQGRYSAPGLLASDNSKLFMELTKGLLVRMSLMELL